MFYKTSAGNEPVREWLKSLEPIENRKAIGADLKTVEQGWPIGMPTCRPMEGTKGLFEVRTNISDKRIARVLFVISGGYMVLLHGFIKKEKKTPKKDLDLAKKRMKEILNEKDK